MGSSVKSSSSSKTFIIVITLVVVVMVGIVVATIMDTKKTQSAKSKIEVSSAVSAKAASIDGKIGESSLTTLDDAQATDPEVGKIVPSFTAQDFAGKEHTITPGTKPYVIFFVAHWCPHCRREVPKLVQMNKEGKLDKDVDIIAVATATAKSSPNYPPSKWLLNEEWPWLTLADTENKDLSTAFGLPGYPYAVYVNADGTIYKRTSGEIDESQITSYVQAIANSAKSK